MGGLTSENCVQKINSNRNCVYSSEPKLSTNDTATYSEFSEKRHRHRRKMGFSLYTQTKGIIKVTLFRELFSILLPLFIYLRFINYVG